MVNPRHWQSLFCRPCCFYLSGSALFRPARSLSLVFKNDVMLSYPWENSHYSQLLVLPLAKHVLECPYPEIEILEVVGSNPPLAHHFFLNDLAI